MVDICSNPTFGQDPVGATLQIHIVILLASKFKSSTCTVQQGNTRGTASVLELCFSFCIDLHCIEW